jgi:hypothetical protein
MTYNIRIFLPKNVKAKAFFTLGLVPNSVIVPYYVHGTNLPIIILSKSKLVHQLEVFLQSLYGIFFPSP